MYKRIDAPIHPSAYLSIFLSIYPSIYISIYLSRCMDVPRRPSRLWPQDRVLLLPAGGRQRGPHLLPQLPAPPAQRQGMVQRLQPGWLVGQLLLIISELVFGGDTFVDSIFDKFIVT